MIHNEMTWIIGISFAIYTVRLSVNRETLLTSREREMVGVGWEGGEST